MIDTPEEFDSRERCRRLPTSPGVYRMLDASRAVIYVGKARELRKRVSSYFNRLAGHSPKVRAMVEQIRDIEVVVTRNETEALILESNLIKELRPRYNIVLRDDKSYPYIYVNTSDKYPRLAFHRGARNGAGRYFGPYPNAGAVRSTINLLQKLFMVRQCEDSFFRNRSRPCLQYQIKRCTAPCVGLVATESYRADMDNALLFLAGRSHDVVSALVAAMEAASARLDFERAAQLRDQITKLQRVQAEQHITAEGGDFDVVACRIHEGIGGVQVFFIRGGRNLGNKTFFPAHTAEASTAEILTAFLAQFYLAGNADRDLPPDIILSEELDSEEAAWLADALGSRRGGALRLRTHVRGERAKWLDMALRNTELAVRDRAATDSDHQRRMEALRDFLELPEAPSRIECFDVSHTRGEAPVASCVVFGAEGARKAEYRKFNIEGVTEGDDYAAMHQALDRRYGRLKREEAVMPDLLLIDGGKGQLAAAVKALKECGSSVPVCSLAKARTESSFTLKEIKRSDERIFIPNRKNPIVLKQGNPALALLERVRDEAHRFSVVSHRRRRTKWSATGNPLEAISGIGEKTKTKLLTTFGSVEAIRNATEEDLKKAGVIGPVAEEILRVLRGGSGEE